MTDARRRVVLSGVSRRRRGVLAAGLVVVVAVIAAGVVALGRDGGPRPPPATIGGALPSSVCSDVASGGAKPDVLIASDLPLLEAGRQELADVIGGVLQHHNFRAGRFVVGYQSCDDWTSRFSDIKRVCAANARAYAHSEDVVAVIGPYSSDCADAQIAILNRAAGGPLALISPSASRPDLTRGAPLEDPTFGSGHQPGVYYPTGARNFFRLTARDDLEGTAHAMLAKQLGLRAVYLLRDPAVGGGAKWTGPFHRKAARVGVNVVGSEAYDAQAKRYQALVDRVARSGADSVLIGGWVDSGGDRLLEALHARLGSRVTIMAGDGFEQVPDVLARAGRASYGMYIAAGNLPSLALHPTPAAERFIGDAGAAANVAYALQTAQATETVLHAIARSNGTRRSVLRQLRRTRVTHGILGRFRFDRNGDITPANVLIVRVTGKIQPASSLPVELQGAIIEGAETIPSTHPPR